MEALIIGKFGKERDAISYLSDNSIQRKSAIAAKHLNSHTVEAINSSSVKTTK